MDIIIRKFTSILKKLFKLVLSFIASTFFIWLVGIYFCNSLVVYEYDKLLKKYTLRPYTVHYHRNEGFAESYSGAHGINYIENILKENRKKIVIWGDSYVEAYQVDDTKKMQQLVTCHLNQLASFNNYMCIGIGMSGESFADYYFDIPKYEKTMENIVSHYIIITDIRDLMPDQPTDKIRGVFRSNPYSLVQEEWEPKFNDFSKMLNGIKFYFVKDIVIDFLSSLKKICFYSKKDNKLQTSMGGKFPEDKMIESFTFLFDKIRNHTNLPITIVYCPNVPQIKHGVICFDDEDSKYFEILKYCSRRYNIDVINAKDEFCAFYFRTGFFPRGFSNSRPSVGHFNENGHKIVSNLIVNHLTNLQ